MKKTGIVLVGITLAWFLSFPSLSYSAIPADEPDSALAERSIHLKQKYREAENRSWQNSIRKPRPLAPPPRQVPIDKSKPLHTSTYKGAHKENAAFSVILLLGFVLLGGGAFYYFRSRPKS